MQTKTKVTMGAAAPAIWVMSVGAVGLLGCDRAEHPAPSGTLQALSAECVAEDAPLADDAWVCPEGRTVECGSATTLYLRDSTDQSCANQELTVVNPGPYTPGTYDIVVRGEAGDPLCSAELTVVDTVAPQLETQVVNLWPPNHKFHSIGIEDCVTVTDACQPELQAEFIWASSDEPVNDIGDGNHEPDILFDGCQRVQVRAERQGPRDGRIYKLGVRVVDGSGNASEGECLVVVDHDRSGVAASDSGEAYRIVLDGQEGRPQCDGENELPPPPSGGDGDGDGDGDEGGDGDGDATPPETEEPGAPV